MAIAKLNNLDLVPGAQRTRGVWMYLVGAGLPLSLGIFDLFLRPQWRYENRNLHTIVEVTGATALLFAASLLQFQFRLEKVSRRLWLCACLAVMGVIGVFHAMDIGVRAHHAFEALYSFLGGLSAAFIWFELPRPVLRLRRWVLASALVTAVVLCLGLVAIEKQMLIEGLILSPSLLVTLNLLGGLLFILASVRLLDDYRKSRDTSELLFANFCLLSGISACLFQMTVAWADFWWLWHLLQLMGALFAAAHIFSTQHRHLRALAKSEAVFRRVFQDAPVGVVVVSDARRIERVNSAFAQGLGYEVPELIGRQMDEFTHEDDRPLAAERVAAILEGRTDHAKFEKRYVGKDGLMRWGEVLLRRLSIDGKRSSMIALINDVTERKKAETALLALNETLEQKVVDRSRELETRAELLERSRAELKKSNERFETLARVMLDVVWDWDLATGAVWHSEGLNCLMGHERRRSTEAGFWETSIRDDERARVRESLQEVIRSGRRFWVEEYHFRRADGSFAFVLDRGYVIHNEAGKPVRMIGVMMDITSRKEAENRLKEQASKLSRSNKDLEQFAYVASHDLKEPLRMVTSYVQLLRRRYASQLDSDAQEYIRLASDGASRMNDLIDDLLAYSHVDRKSDPFKVVDVSSVVETVQENLRRSILENAAVIDVGPLPRIHADETQVTQLFQNLVSNALKYRGAEPPRIEISAEDGGGEWKFSVKDNGIGIDSKYKHKIFKLFQRLHTKEQYPGTGIGLAICQKIVERHGGKIWFESQLGSGATFYFTMLDIGLGVNGERSGDSSMREHS